METIFTWIDRLSTSQHQFRFSLFMRSTRVNYQSISTAPWASWKFQRVCWSVLRHSCSVDSCWVIAPPSCRSRLDYGVQNRCNHRTRERRDMYGFDRTGKMQKTVKDVNDGDGYPEVKEHDKWQNKTAMALLDSWKKNSFRSGLPCGWMKRSS